MVNAKDATPAPAVLEQLKKPMQVSGAAINKRPTDLVEVCRNLPKDIFEIRPGRAFLAFAQAVIQTALCMWALTYCNSWWSLPIGWFWAGTASVGLFVIGHDCAHGAFSTNPMVAEIVGTICMSPLSWPYNGWLVTHNHHHAYTNNLDKDHLWHPLMKETVTKLSKVVRDILYYFYVGPLFFESSILHHAMHFNVLMFPKRYRGMVVRSCFSALVVVGIIFHYLYTHGGMWAVFKYWIMPYLVFNFWLSTYTYFHHKSPEIGWLKADEWNKAQAQLFHTAHVDYHPIFEFLHFDINWHIPHHVSVRIPWYNLRRATFALMKTYGNEIHNYEMSLSFWMDTTTKCHVYDEQRLYLSIDEAVAEAKSTKSAKKTKSN